MFLQQDGSKAMFSKISLLSSALVLDEGPSGRIFAITTNDLEMSIAIKHHDLRFITHIASQEKWMTTHDVSVTGLELGPQVSPRKSLNSLRTLWPHLEMLPPAAPG